MVVTAVRVEILFYSATVTKAIYKPTAGSHTAQPKMVSPEWAVNVPDPMVLI